MPDAADLQTLTHALTKGGFQGDIETDYAQRVVASTDNSIYQLLPQAIIYPRVEDDINLVMRCIADNRSAGFSLCARGGGTGTNGQSLSDGLVLDCSRYLNNIISYSPEHQTVTVQPGVVLDQLNAWLKPYDVFFPVDISSSSRATIGGMVATDASGKGSLIYGKTSRYIESLDAVLYDGSSYRARAHSLSELSETAEDIPEFALSLFYQLASQEEEINRIFPRIDRGMTGYNLQQCIAEQDIFNPCYLLAGSEGTLAITRRITLRVIPRPGHQMLTVIFYHDFQKGLDHVQELLKSKPAAIEMLDDKILMQATNDSVWFRVKAMFGDAIDTDIKALNYVEHLASSEQSLLQQQHQLEEILHQTSNQYSVITFKTERDAANISALWEVRKRAVGLLAKSSDNKRGIAFVEDSAVPVTNLSQYITGFRKILDDHQLEYGMYGHADAGVLHVRPMLDMLQQPDRALIRKISDQVAVLAKQNNGVLWGEHGRGFRGEYTPLFFGESLYPLLCKIKEFFDPFNLLNPGKLATPNVQQSLTRLDTIPYRGELDSYISSDLQHMFPSSLACNGNGACFNWSYNESMCPSYKATRNRLYSPKGRAALIREWLRQRSSTQDNVHAKTLEQDLFDSLQWCLSCKSCTSSCPLNVDIPEMKSRFLQYWQQQYGTLSNDFFILHFDRLIRWGARLPSLSNWLLQRGLSARWFERLSGLTRLPAFNTTENGKLSRLPARPGKHSLENNSLIILCDNYLDYFEHPLLQSGYNLLRRLGYTVYLSQPLANGKLLHVKGYRERFKQQAQSIQIEVSALSETAAQLISIETVSRLMFDMEYPEILHTQKSLNIQSVESFLSQHPDRTAISAHLKHSHKVTLLPHCMEQTCARESSAHWQQVFSRLGIKLDVISPGCCGMSGIFGHEVENQKLADDIFKLAWKPTVERLLGEKSIILATGFSCRCQLKNHQVAVVHPLQYLEQVLAGKQDNLSIIPD